MKHANGTEWKPVPVSIITPEMWLAWDKAVSPADEFHDMAAAAPAYEPHADDVERVARAIDSVKIFSRYNDWTEDAVNGLPVEICRRGIDGEPEIVVICRFDSTWDEKSALFSVVREQRARAAIRALLETE